MYLFEHEERLFAPVEVRRGLIGDEVAGIGLLEAFDNGPDIFHLF